MTSNKNSQKSENILKADFLKAIGHPIRISILQFIIEKESVSVTEICKKLNTEQSLTSHHLANLRQKGVLIATRTGKNIHYSLKSLKVAEILKLVEFILK